MIEAPEFIKAALKRGYTFWAGVPCSFLKPLINCVIQCPDLDYTMATSEGEAVGIAAGAYLGGRKTVVMCQNAGLGNMVNPLTSLNYPFHIPTLLIVTHRGAPGLSDEPQHGLMGPITSEMLDIMRIPQAPFPKTVGELQDVFVAAEGSMAKGIPFALVMAKGSVAEYPLRKKTKPPMREIVTPMGQFKCAVGGRLARREAIRIVRECLTGAEAIVATTGKIGRELFSLGHRSNQIYIVGSMGCAAGIGFGVHQASQKPVVVLDGDGAVLMKMGTLATIGHYLPQGFIHIILDNETYDSTGGQATVAPTTDFTAVAASCGYRNVWMADTAEHIAAAVRKAQTVQGPNLIHIKVAPGSDPGLGRPTVTPVEVKEQFMAWVQS